MPVLDLFASVSSLAQLRNLVGGGSAVVIYNEAFQLPAAVSPVNDAGVVVTVAGHTLAFDGGGGPFGWTTDTAAPDNDGTVVVPLSLPRLGCWKRIWTGNMAK